MSLAKGFIESVASISNPQVFLSDCKWENFTCPTSRWKCHISGRCIAEENVCNAEIKRWRGNCGTGEDEQNCEDWKCLSNYIKCGDQKQCVKVRNSQCQVRQ